MTWDQGIQFIPGMCVLVVVERWTFVGASMPSHSEQPLDQGVACPGIATRMPVWPIDIFKKKLILGLDLDGGLQGHTRSFDFLRGVPRGQ